MKYFKEALPADKTYFAEKGWLTLNYYYDDKINPIKKLAGKFFDEANGSKRNR